MKHLGPMEWLSLAGCVATAVGTALGAAGTVAHDWRSLLANPYALMLAVGAGAAAAKAYLSTGAADAKREALLNGRQP